MRMKEVRRLISKRNGRYSYYDRECEAFVVFHESWSLTKCRNFLIDLIKRDSTERV